MFRGEGDVAVGSNDPDAPSAYCLRGKGSTRFGYFESSDLDPGVSSANKAKRGVFPEPTFGSPWRIGARLPGSGPPCGCADSAFNGLSEYAISTSERRFAMVCLTGAKPKTSEAT